MENNLYGENVEFQYLNGLNLEETNWSLALGHLREQVQRGLYSARLILVEKRCSRAD